VAVEECAVRVPPLRPVGPDGGLVACHLVDDDGTGPRLA
jgi:peptide/nickel transport system ATP-binding protein/oligopeptide transport system ATP-binding protein